MCVKDLVLSIEMISPETFLNSYESNIIFEGAEAVVKIGGSSLKPDHQKQFYLNKSVKRFLSFNIKAHLLNLRTKRTQLFTKGKNQTKFFFLVEVGFKSLIIEKRENNSILFTLK